MKAIGSLKITNFAIEKIYENFKQAENYIVERKKKKTDFNVSFVYTK